MHAIRVLVKIFLVFVKIFLCTTVVLSERKVTNWALGRWSFGAWSVWFIWGIGRLGHKVFEALLNCVVALILILTLALILIPTLDLTIALTLKIETWNLVKIGRVPENHRW